MNDGIHRTDRDRPWLAPMAPMAPAKPVAGQGVHRFVEGRPSRQILLEEHEPAGLLVAQRPVGLVADGVP